MTAPAVVSDRALAGIFDLPAAGPSECHNTSFSQKYIGGSGGVGWYQYFMDSNTGETYRVYCTDGVNGGHGPRSESDQQWLGRCYGAIVRRCHREAELGKSEIQISRNERAVMQGMNHIVWLETAPGKHDGEQSQEGLDGGFVGLSHGIPVICDLEKEDEFPPRVTRSFVENALAFATTVPLHDRPRAGEVYIGKYETPYVRSDLPWKTLRLGYSARDTSGRLTRDRNVPVFIQKTELDEAQEQLRLWEACNQ